MRVAGVFSLKNGETVLQQQYAAELATVHTIIASIDSAACMTKQSRERTRQYSMLYSPKCLNNAFKRGFAAAGWLKHREYCIYPTQYYVSDYTPVGGRGNVPYREMDFVRNRVGVEVQFGKYAFMVYNVCAKMTIFRNLNIIDVGIEVVPIKAFAAKMSTGVSYFEQFVWDLEQRGTADIDIPVLILGIDA